MRDQKKKWLFINCLAASIGIHFVAFFLYSKYPLSLDISLRNSLTSELANEILKEAFDEITLTPYQKPYDNMEPPILNEEKPAFLEKVEQRPQLPLSENNDALLDEPLVFLTSLDFNPHLVLKPLMEEEAITVQPMALKKESTIPSIVQDLPLANLLNEPELEEVRCIAFSRNLIKEEIDFKGPPPPSFLPELSNHCEDPLPLKQLSEPITPLFVAAPSKIISVPSESLDQCKSALQDYALLEKVPTTEWKENFKVDFQILPSQNDEECLFSLILRPAKNMHSMQLKQTFYFLIDHSSSIEKHRYAVFKRAVSKALSSLQKKDTFNIFIIGNKVSYLSKHDLAAKPANIQLAEQFLEKQQDDDPSFDATDIYSLLEKIIPSTVRNDRVYTAILVSDGRTLLSSKEQHKIISEWREKNEGKISLYTAAAGKENNLVLLDLISSCNKGELLYSETQASLPRKLTKLIKDLSCPILKDVMMTAVPSTKGAHVTFYPTHARLRTLYASKPYRIIGKMDKLTDFTLILEGRNQDQLILIEKKMLIEQAKRGNRNLEKLWAQEQAHFQYEEYLKKGKISYLKDAKEFLPFNE